MDNFIKKRRTTITPNLKKAIWDIYIGPGIMITPCPLCGVRELYRNQSTGYEAAHIVADKFFEGSLTSLYLFPTCSVCNNDCSDLCLLDFLWCRERYDVLRKMLWDIFSHYIKERPHESNSQMWKIIDHLYGPNRFPAGGGIENIRQIYQLCKTEQIARLMEQSANLNAQLIENSQLMQRLLTEKLPCEQPRFG